MTDDVKPRDIIKASHINRITPDDGEVIVGGETGPARRPISDFDNSAVLAQVDMDLSAKADISTVDTLATQVATKADVVVVAGVVQDVAGHRSLFTQRRSSTATFFDDFARPDGPLGTSPTGHTWTEYDQQGRASGIVAGRLVLVRPSGIGAYASYPGVVLPGTPTTVDIELSFTGTTGDNNNVTLILSSMEGGFGPGIGNPMNMLHLNLTRRYLTINVYENNIGSPAFLSVPWHTPFALDGAPGMIHVTLDSLTHTLTVTEPDGTVHSVVNSRMSAVAGPLLIAEPYYVDTSQDVVPRVEYLAAWVPSVAALRTDPGVANRYPNPSFEVDAANVAGNRANETITNPVDAAATDGTHVLQVVCPGTLEYEGINLYTANLAGQTGAALPVTGSFDIFGSGTVQLRMDVNYTNATQGNSAVSNITLTGTPQRVSVTYTLDPARTVDMVLVNIAGPAIPTAFTMKIDRVQIEESAVATPYGGAGVGQRIRLTSADGTGYWLAVSNTGTLTVARE